MSVLLECVSRSPILNLVEHTLWTFFSSVLHFFQQQQQKERKKKKEVLDCAAEKLNRSLRQPARG